MRSLGGLLVVCALGCGGGNVVSGDAGPSGTDAAGSDAGPSGADAWPLTDAAALPDTGADAGTMPELCTGGLDEDGDFQIDCADSDCWDDAGCMLADVQHVVPAATTACGDPITIDATASAMACAMIGMPMGSTYATDCTSGIETAVGHLYCDASGAPVALWLEEHITTPRTQEMLSARTFRITEYERESIVDWERQVSGPSSREGATMFPTHDALDFAASGARDAFRVITIRSVQVGDSISRLLGMTQITSLVDLDNPMSMDTRDTRHLGGLSLTIPTP